jgi:hypothetical protein
MLLLPFIYLYCFLTANLRCGCVQEAVFWNMTPSTLVYGQLTASTFKVVLLHKKTTKLIFSPRSLL